jgi:hypothetical protein
LALGLDASTKESASGLKVKERGGSVAVGGNVGVGIVVEVGVNVIVGVKVGVDTTVGAAVALASGTVLLLQAARKVNISSPDKNKGFAAIIPSLHF